MQLISNNQANIGTAPAGRPNFSQDQARSYGKSGLASPGNKDSKDTLSLSKERQERAAQEATPETASKEVSPSTNTNSSKSSELTQEELTKVQELKQRDTEVRTHEQAHMAAAGQYSQGGPSYSLQKGPDGKSYAVGGEVSIDVGKGRTPEETVAKMRVIKQAALAPANPSSTDRRIAAQASVKEAQARQEMSASMQEQQLQSERQPDEGSPDERTSPEITTENAAPTRSTGTLKKAMVDAYKLAASF